MLRCLDCHAFILLFHTTWSLTKDDSFPGNFFLDSAGLFECHRLREYHLKLAGSQLLQALQKIKSTCKLETVVAGSRMSDAMSYYASDVFDSYVLLITSAAEGPFPNSNGIKSCPTVLLTHTVLAQYRKTATIFTVLQ